MRLRDIESALPPGFRFCPSDEELVCHYLHKKVNNHRISELLDVDLHIQEPWQLPEGAKLSDNEWYFFSFRDRKYATGLRSNRATKNGYWKATGKDRVIRDPLSQTMVGMRKTLVFYCGRAPNGVKTNWVMHEFRLETPDMPPKEDWVLCRVFLKSKGEEAMGMGGDTSDFNDAIGTICSNSPYAPLPSIPLQVMCYADTATCYMQQHADHPHYGYSLPDSPRPQRHQLAGEAATEDAAAMEGAEDAGNGGFSFLDGDCNVNFQFLLGSVDDEGCRREGSGSMDCAAVAFFSQL